MKTKPTVSEKFQYVAQYYGQKVLLNENGKLKRIKGLNLIDIEVNAGKLVLIPLSRITDKHAVKAANMAFKFGNFNWVIDKRDKTGVWMSAVNSVGIKYYFRLNEYGEIYSSITFPEDEKHKKVTCDNNIGGVGSNIENGIPYIHVLDFLRSKGYAVQYKDVIVRNLVKWGWLELKQVN